MESVQILNYFPELIVMVKHFVKAKLAISNLRDLLLDYYFGEKYVSVKALN